MTITLRPWQIFVVAVAVAILLIAVGALVLGSFMRGTKAQYAAVPSEPTAMPATSTPVASPTPQVCSETLAAQKVRPSVVRVQTTTSVGTGIIVSSTGTVMTNDHVVVGYSTAILTLSDGRVLPATVTLHLPDKDLALLQLGQQNLSPVTWGDVEALKPGTKLLAWGYALDIPGEPSLTIGTFSALRIGRTVKYVQTDTPINLGNSGGPLFNQCGEVVGIVTWGLFEAQGLNFAISSTDARQAALSSTAGAISSPSVTELSPEDTVALFYSLIDIRAFAQAYSLFSSRFRSTSTLTSWQAGYSTTEGVHVESVRRVSGAGTMVQSSVLATDIIGGQRLVRRFAGTWTLVHESDGWKLDAGRIQQVP